MTVILVRTLIFYFILGICMRVMGKRQIGELQMPEFVTAVMLSEMASLPITDTDIPLAHGIVSVLTLSSLEIVISFVAKKFPAARKVIDGSPLLLMAQGEFVEKNLDKARITLDEIFSELRTNGYRSPDEADYIILEQTGKLSIIPKARFDALTPDDLAKTVSETGISHAVVIDGKANDRGLENAGKDREWLEKELRAHGARINELLFMTVDGKANIVIRKKESAKKR